MAKKKKSHNKFEIGLIILGLLIGIVAFIGFTKHPFPIYQFKLKTLLSSPQLDPEVLDPIYNQAVNLAFDDTSIVLETPTDAHVWWIAQNDANIWIPATGSVQFSLEVPTNEPLSIEQIYNQKSVQQFVATAQKEFESRGYHKNALNSSKSINDDKFYDYVIAYEKGTEVCTISINPDGNLKESNAETVYYSTTVSCSDQFQKSFDEQNPIIQALDVKDSIVEVTKHDGDFYYIQQHYRRSGNYIIAKKSGNSYKEIFAGQDYPPCSVMEKNGVPKNLYGECYTSSDILE